MDDVMVTSSALYVTLGADATPAMNETYGVPVGLPSDATEAQVAYARRLWQQWCDAMPSNPEDGSGDVEDFWEMAARLDAALHAGAPRVLVADVVHYETTNADGSDDDGSDVDWLTIQLEPGKLGIPELGPLRNLNGLGPVVRDVTLGQQPTDMVPTRPAREVESTVVEYPGTDPNTVVHYGPITRHAALWGTVGTQADNYPYTETFRRFSGRRVTVAGFNVPAPHAEVADVLATWAGDGVAAAVVKTVTAKHGIWRVPCSLDATVCRREFVNRADWMPIKFEGDPYAFLVQEHISMEFEYRFFVVDGRLVTGAGCVEEFTPLYADHTHSEVVFSSLMRQHRAYNLDAIEGDLLTTDPTPDDSEGESAMRMVKSKVTDEPDLLKLYVSFAERVVAAAVREDVFPRAYTMDVAWNPDRGEPVVIEFNGMTNSGLYASKPTCVTRALMTPKGSHV